MTAGKVNSETLQINFKKLKSFSKFSKVTIFLVLVENISSFIYCDSSSRKVDS